MKIQNTISFAIAAEPSRRMEHQLSAVCCFAFIELTYQTTDDDDASGTQLDRRYDVNGVGRVVDQLKRFVVLNVALFPTTSRGNAN